MGWTIFYGAELSVALALAWASARPVYVALGVNMLVSWAFYNIVVRAVGFQHGLLLDALVDALIACVVGALGYQARSRLAWWIVVLFVAEEATHICANIWRAEDAPSIHAVLNAIFALQVLLIGGAARVAMASSRPRAPDLRLPALRFHRR